MATVIFILNCLHICEALVLLEIFNCWVLMVIQVRKLRIREVTIFYLWGLLIKFNLRFNCHFCLIFYFLLLFLWLIKTITLRDARSLGINILYALTALILPLLHSFQLLRCINIKKEPELEWTSSHFLHLFEGKTYQDFS